MARGGSGVTAGGRAHLRDRMRAGGSASREAGVQRDRWPAAQRRRRRITTTRIITTARSSCRRVGKQTREGGQAVEAPVALRPERIDAVT